MAKAKIKTLLGTGLAALCSHIKQCNTALGDLSEATANGFEETDDILHEKQDVTAAVSFTIPVDGWGEDDSSPGYFYCDIPMSPSSRRAWIEIFRWSCIRRKVERQDSSRTGRRIRPERPGLSRLNARSGLPD